MKKFWIGIKGKVVDKIYCEDVTELYNKAIKKGIPEDAVLNFIANDHKGFMNFFVDAKNQKEAINGIIEKFTKKSHLEIIK